MNNLNGAVNLIVVLFSILAAIAGAFGVARYSYLTSGMKALRSDRDDLITRVQILENEDERKGKEIKALQSQLEVERDARHVLEQVITGKEELEAIIGLLQAHHANVQTWQKNTESKLTELLRLNGSRRESDGAH